MPAPATETGRTLLDLCQGDWSGTEQAAATSADLSAEVVGAVASVLMRRKFAGGADIRSITVYVMAALDRLGEPSDGRRAREAEAVVRSAFGELEVLYGIAGPDLLELNLMLLVDLARTMHLDPSQLAGVIVRGERTVARVQGQLHREKMSPEGLVKRWMKRRFPG